MSNVYPWLRLRAAGLKCGWLGHTTGACRSTRCAARGPADCGHRCVPRQHGQRLPVRPWCALRAGAVVGRRARRGRSPVGGRRADRPSATPVDFLVAPGFKWLLGSLGAGLMHVRADWIERAAPPMIGWLAVTTPGKQSAGDPAPSRSHALRDRLLEPRRLRGARAGLALLHDVGPEWAYARIAALADRLYQGLADMASIGVRLCGLPRSRPSGPASWRSTPPAARTCTVTYESQAIHVGDWLDHIRVDPSFYNTEAEIDRFLDETKAFLEERPI